MTIYGGRNNGWNGVPLLVAGFRPKEFKYELQTRGLQIYIPQQETIIFKLSCKVDFSD